MLVQLPSWVRRRINYYGFASSILSWTFDSALDLVVYRCSPERDWSSLYGELRWLPYGISDCWLRDLIDPVLPSGKSDAIDSLCVDRILSAGLLYKQYLLQTGLD